MADKDGFTVAFKQINTGGTGISAAPSATLFRLGTRVYLEDKDLVYLVVANATTGAHEYLLLGQSSLTPTSGLLGYGAFTQSVGTVAAIAPGAAVPFATPGVVFGSVGQVSTTTFRVGTAGVYEIVWQGTVTGAGQLELVADQGAGYAVIAGSIAGRSAVTSQIIGSVTATLAANSQIQIRNPSGDSLSLTLTPSAGGTSVVAASLTIKQIG